MYYSLFNNPLAEVCILRVPSSYLQSSFIIIIISISIIIAMMMMIIIIIIIVILIIILIIILILLILIIILIIILILIIIIIIQQSYFYGVIKHYEWKIYNLIFSRTVTPNDTFLMILKSQMR